MKRNIQAIRGMNDMLPDEAIYWQHVEAVLKSVMDSYGYQEIRTPIIEHTELFVRTIGEVTDIVEKEMYIFVDRNNDSLTLRPEGTAGCVRAGIEHGLLHNQIQRLWYQGAMFRHERPQKGRYRQFHQFGVEAFGMPGPEIDTEILFLATRIWQLLGIADKVILQINSLGNSRSRAVYRQALTEYLQKNFDQLDLDSRHRLTTNPLRILDSKNPDLQELIANAPKLLDYLDANDSKHFSKLCSFLDAAKINYEINPRLVRGLDYYCLTAFEWVTTLLGSQGAICGGGHYDGLVEELGGRSTPAIGFAIGLERLVSLVKDVAVQKFTPHVYLVMISESAVAKGLILAENLRNSLPDLHLIVDCKGGDFGPQLKRADKSNASIALIFAEKELQSNTVTIKYLREAKPQQSIEISKLIDFLRINL